MNSTLDEPRPHLNASVDRHDAPSPHAVPLTPRKRDHRVALWLLAALTAYAVMILLADRGLWQPPRMQSGGAAGDQPHVRALMQGLVDRMSQIETALGRHRDDVAILQTQLHALRQLEENDNDDRMQRDGRLAQLADTVQRLADTQDALKRRMTAVAKAAPPPAAATKTAAPASQPAARPALPFTVIAVDLWSDRPYVALSLAGAIDFIGVGDHVGGWQVQAIDLQARRVVFVDRDGRSFVAEVQP